MTITKIHARQIFDSRGNPTVEVDVTTNHGKETRLSSVSMSLSLDSSSLSLLSLQALGRMTWVKPDLV